MSMSISPEHQKLLSEIVAMGDFSTEAEALAEALRLLKIVAHTANGTVLSRDQWRARFESHLASTPATETTFVDDSRDSIYEGRGE